MREVANAYDQWANVYDTNVNKTRDAEAELLRRLTSGLQPTRVLELGCGSGKNTGYLASMAQEITAVDFSEGMLAKAREKHSGPNVQFVQQDLSDHSWKLTADHYQLATFSLVLEHLPSLIYPFTQAAWCLQKEGYLYVGELHPFKQYMGSQARYTNEVGEEQLVPAFTHHLQDYFQAAQAAGLRFVQLAETFDEGGEKQIPRLIGWLFQK